MNKTFEINTFELFDKRWALITAGTINKHNSMTISWGGTGTLWSKPVVSIYVKPCRFTHRFIEENDYFVVSFFNEEYRKALEIMGTKSGKEVDKDALANLTPIKYKDVVIYQEAEVTLICKKIYQNNLNINSIPKEIVDKYYKKEEPHTMYVGEVIEILK